MRLYQASPPDCHLGRLVLEECTGTWYWISLQVALSLLRLDGQVAALFLKAGRREADNYEWAAVVYLHQTIDHFLQTLDNPQITKNHQNPVKLEEITDPAMVNALRNMRDGGHWDRGVDRASSEDQATVGGPRTRSGMKRTVRERDNESPESSHRPIVLARSSHSERVTHEPEMAEPLSELEVKHVVVSSDNGSEQESDSDVEIITVDKMSNGPGEADTKPLLPEVVAPSKRAEIFCFDSILSSPLEGRNPNVLTNQLKENQHTTQQAQEALLKLVMNKSIAVEDYQAISEILAKRELENRIKVIKQAHQQADSVPGPSNLVSRLFLRPLINMLKSGVS